MSRDHSDAQVTPALSLPSAAPAAHEQRAADVAAAGIPVTAPLQRVVHNVLQQAHAQRMAGDWYDPIFLARNCKPLFQRSEP